MFTKCAEMCIFGPNCKTRCSMVSQQTRTCDHKIDRRASTKWSRACDKRLARLISYIHCTSEYKQYRHLGNAAPQGRLGLFQDSDKIRNPLQVEHLCVFGSHTFDSKKLDMQEADICVTQLNRSWNYLSMQESEWTELSRSIFGILKLKYHIQIQINKISSPEQRNPSF